MTIALSEKKRLLREKLLQKEGLAAAPARRIPRRTGTGPAPLSFGQQRLWFLHQLDPGSAAYHIAEAVELNGALDRGALERALAEVVRRHEVLRTGYLAVDGTPVQAVFPPEPVEIPSFDLAGVPAEEREARAGEAAAEMARRPFDLTGGALLRATLLRLEEGRHVLVLAMHHIASDGWSMGILVRELTALYQAFAAGEPSPLSELPIQYADFAEWQREELQGEPLEAHVRWWKEALAGAPQVLDLPTDHPRPAVADAAGARAPLAVSRDTTAALRALAEPGGASLHMALAAALGLLLHRYTGQDDLLLGTPSASRSRPEIEGLIGFFINTLVLRVDLTGEPDFPGLLGRVREMALGAHAHQDLPFERLVDALELPRDISRSPLFQVMLTLQNLPPAAVSGGNGQGGANAGLAVRNFGFEAGTAQFDLHFVIFEGPGGLYGNLNYRTDLFEAATARRLARHFEAVIAGIAADSYRPLSDLPLLLPEERQQLLTEWNDTATAYPEGAPLHRLIEEQVERKPEAPAATFEDRHLTYAELDRLAGRLAAELRTHGCGPESRVAVALERSLELMVALLGVLKAGAAYVPLDSEYPQERLAYMLADSRPAALLTHESLRDRLPAAEGIPTLYLDLATDGEGGGALSRAEARGRVGEGELDQSLAYMIYTSGSTGRPKGAMVNHRGIRNRLLWMQETYRLTPADTVLQKTPFSFDVSVWELFWPLMTGARMVLAKPGGHRDASYMADLIARERVTVMHFVPSMLQAFLEEPDLDRRCASLRLVVASGEALSAELEQRFAERLPGARLENLYGPTEASVDVTSWTCGLSADRRPVPIGRPIANTRIHLLDPHLRPVPVGVAGELWIAGANVGRGYLGRPELTAERFVPDPFGETGARAYRTGDLARFRADGAIEFLGRIDHQVKVRGFRIELGEIEAVLASHPGVREVAVTVREDRGARSLVAYVVPPAAAVEDLRRLSRESLPEYMVPAFFVGLEALPLSPNGKLDRRLLPAPDPSAWAAAEYAPPHGPAEEVLAETWAQVLDLDRVGAHDNFFNLGGDSILSLRMLTRLRERGLDLTLQQVFQHQTVRELARVARPAFADGSAAPGPVRTAPLELVSEADRALLSEGIEDAYPLTRTQAGMLFHSDLHPETAVYHDVLGNELRGPFDEAVLRRTLARVMARHPLLRTSFHLRGFSRPLQLVHAEVPVPLEVDDLRGLPAEEQRRAAFVWFEAERHRDFEWTQPPLARFHVHRTGDDRFLFSLSFHHAVLDGWSVAALMTELFRTYLGLLADPALPEEAPPAAAFRDFVGHEQALLGSQEARGFWQDHLAGSTLARVPSWPVGPDSPPRRGRDLEVPVPDGITAGLRRITRTLGVPLKSALLAAHFRVLSYLCGTADVTTGLVTHGRLEQEGGDEVLGLFLNTLPLRLRLGRETWRELVRRAFDLEKEILPYHRYPLAELQAAHGEQPLFETSFGFNYFHVYRETRSVVAGSGGERMESLDSFGYEETNIPFQASFHLDPDGTILGLRLNYLDPDYRPAYMGWIGEVYNRALAALAEVPDTPFSEALLLSAAERHQALREWNDTATGVEEEGPRAVHERIADQARRTPDAPAVVSLAGTMSYADLDRRAARLAFRLRSLGVGPESRVGLCADRSPEMVASILAVLRTGAAYVPLDPTYPAERLAFMVEDAGLSALLLHQRWESKLPASSEARIFLDLPETGTDEAPPVAVLPESLAYVIYTSGSTGRPKGVMVSHAGLSAYLDWALGAYLSKESGGSLLHTSISFDLTVTSLFVPLLAGRPVGLVPESEAGEALVAAYREQRGLSFVKMTPSHARLLGPLLRADPEVAERARTLILGGEALLAEDLALWREKAPETRIVNEYGPTETVVGCCVHVAPAGELGRGIVPIGRPIAGARLHLLDAHLQPLPAVLTGEIWIGGAGVARGYLGRPDVTADRFRPDPFGGVGNRLYRTGDLARRRPDGSLEYLGRADQQVKVRGYRIELGEIEAVLARHPGLREAAVAVWSGGESGEDARLVAYVVSADPAAPVPSDELRRFAGAWLPEPMIPATWVPLEALPLTPNGKVDRAGLPDPASLNAGPAYVAPRTPTEEKLAALWAEALGVEQVGVHDSFLSLGGHSLMAIQLMQRVRAEFEIRLPLRTLYSAGNVENFAAAVDDARAKLEPAAPVFVPEQPAIPEGTFDPHEPLPLLDIQEAFWAGASGLFDLGGSSANVYVEYEVPGVATLFTDELSAAFEGLIAHHPMLRTVVSSDGMQRILPEVPPFTIRVEDLTRAAEEIRERRLEAVREELRYARHRSDRWPLFDVVLQQVEENRIRVHARFDAMLVDGTSRNLLINEIIRRLATAGTETEVPPLEVTYQDHVRALLAFRATATYGRARAYWLERLPKLPPPPRLPLVREIGPETVPRLVKREVPLLAGEAWVDLKRRAGRSGITPSGVLTAAFGAALQPWAEEPSFTLGIAGSYHPPIHPQAEQIIGTFTHLHVLEVEGGAGTFDDFARRFQARFIADLDHQQFSGHQVLRELNLLNRAWGRATLPVQFTSIVSAQSGPPAPAAEPAAEEAAPPQVQVDMTQLDLMISLPQVLLFCVVVEEGDGQLTLISQAVEEVFPEDLVPGLLDHYRSLLERLAADEASWGRAVRSGPASLPAASPDASLADLRRRCGIGDEDRVLALHPAFAALGNTVEERENAAVWCSAPAVLEEAVALAEQSPGRAALSLRTALLYGDRIPVRLPERLAALCPGVRLYAVWGTESTPFAAAGPVEAADLEPATGCPRVLPLAGRDLRVLDGAGQPRPDWAPGELHLDGKATGELARRLPDGRVEVLGGTGEDTAPLASLGYGADPRRIEAALQRHPGIRHAVVAWRADSGRRGQLLAWIVAGPAGATLSDREIRSHLRASLPEHRVPAAFVRLESLPLLPDGRVDRASLPLPAAAPALPSESWSALETELAGLWEEVLGRRPERRGDLFFELGGDSLKAVRLLARVGERYGLETPLPAFFQEPTVAHLAALVEQARADQKAANEAERRKVSPFRRLLARLPLPQRWREAALAVDASEGTAVAANAGMRTFWMIWLGQLISGIGTGLGSFTLGLWIYQQRSSATQLALVGTVAMITGLTLGPFAGAIADRFDRRKVLLFTDLGSAAMTILLATALYTGLMRVQYVYIMAVVMTIFGTFHRPAFSASIALLVPRRQLVRAGAMGQVAGSTAGILCPPLAGFLVGQMSYGGVILVDVMTFLFAAATVAWARIPRPPRAEGAQQTSIFADILEGLNYIKSRAGLLALLVLFAYTNFNMGIVQILLTPLILSFASAVELGTVNAAAAIGGLVGTLVLSAWGGPQRRVWGILGVMLIQGSILMLGGFQPSIPLIACAVFLFMFTLPIVGSCTGAIWSSKVAPEVQGRVFSMVGMLTTAVVPFSYMLAGTLADRVFTPLMMPDGALADTFVGEILGTGPGRGIGLLYVCAGILVVVGVVLFFLNPRLRKVESELPDFARPDETQRAA
jgi:amino acid adenylation domain-containing protein